MTKVVELSKYRSTVRSKANGVAFPQLYRVQGFAGDPDILENTGELVALKDPEPLQYGLLEATSQSYGLLDVSSTPIRGLDQTIDTGWIVIRHHMSDALVEGYLDGMMDRRTSDFGPSEAIYRTSEGVFSLIHLAASPGCQDHLVIYVTKVSHPKCGWVDHHMIILPDGSITENDELLYPPDED